MPKLRPLLLVALIALGAVVVAATASAVPGPTPPHHPGPPLPPGLPGPGPGGQIYIDDNTSAGNTVGAFDRHADGSLTPVSGSPFAVGGAGNGSATASQGSIQRSSDGRFLLVADTGSNQLSVALHRPGRSAHPHRSRLLERDAACQHRGAQRPRLRGERGRPEPELHRLLT